jgi:hypothetical protein
LRNGRAAERPLTRRVNAQYFGEMPRRETSANPRVRLALVDGMLPPLDGDPLEHAESVAIAAAVAATVTNPSNFCNTSSLRCQSEECFEKAPWIG